MTEFKDRKVELSFNSIQNNHKADTLATQITEVAGQYLIHIYTQKNIKDSMKVDYRISLKEYFLCLPIKQTCCNYSLLLQHPCDSVV